MAKINFKKIADKIVPGQLSEKSITNYKTFYKNYLIDVKPRQEILRELYQYCLRYQNIKFASAFLQPAERSPLEKEIATFLAKHFNNEIVNLYYKKLPEPVQKRQIKDDASFLEALVTGLSTAFETVNEKTQQELNYRKNFLIFLNNCLFHFGLHQDILLRNETAYKRYNIRVEHTFKSRKTVSDHKLLLRPEILESEYIKAYHNQLPLQLNGKLIPFTKITSIKITSSLLKDDEIELFAQKNDFSWTNAQKDDEKFIFLCKEETDSILKNPYLIQTEVLLRNNSSNFIHLDRITALKRIKSTAFDFVKLVRLCEELNSVTTNQNYYAASLILRSIIDHIPPYFECNNFSELANNYSGGTKSFKKSMQNLNTSLRNIADNNIHSQIRQKEVLPNTNQIDFSQELDLLIAEIIRVAK